MKGIILAAGAGRRLWPHTETFPKALVRVQGSMTILDIGLHNLASVGITDVTIVIGYRADAVRARQIDFERTYGVDLEFVINDRAEDWNNCYSLWLARHHMRHGALLLNGDVVHPASVEAILLEWRGHGIVVAVDAAKRLADEEMKVRVDDRDRLTRITKSMPPEEADGEYIGLTLIERQAVEPLVDALERTWRRNPSLYYEDGYQAYVDGGGTIQTASIGTVDWVEVDDHKDLERARVIACRC